jgi:predicted negative regulator of RcsB-dependent stress response
MPTPAESSSSKSPSLKPVSASPDIDETLQSFGKKYGPVAVIGAVLVLAFYLGREGWNYFGAQREAGVQSEFAAAHSPEQLKAFVAAHPDHPLAGVADLQAADDAYSAGQSSAALAGYQEALRVLTDPVLKARATIGAAMVQIGLGQTADGQAALRKLLDDTAQLPVVRAQAGYQLAALAASAGQGDEVQRIQAQLIQIDKDGSWTKNVFNLTVAPPANGSAPAAAGAPAKSGISFKSAGK